MPVFLIPLVALVAPVIIKGVVDLVSKKAKRVPKKTVAVLAGLAVGGGLVAAGVPAEQAAVIGGLSGPAAVGFHEAVATVRGRRRKEPATRPAPPPAPHPNHG